MNRIFNYRVMISLLLLVCCRPLWAQDDNEKINSNLGVAMSLPINPTSEFATLGWGFTAGAGYNFTQHHAIIGEFMWNRLYSTNEAMVPLRAAESSGLDGHSGVYAVTANYRFELRGKRFGTYFIGGGGWYYRNNSLTSQVTITSGTVCTPALVWWGTNCTSGVVTADQTLRSWGSSAFGGNAGAGFTVKVGEPSYRFYAESRYHYAPTKNVNTQLVNITVGIRY
jgi:hypothetical protein